MTRETTIFSFPCPIADRWWVWADYHPDTQTLELTGPDDSEKGRIDLETLNTLRTYCATWEGEYRQLEEVFETLGLSGVPTVWIETDQGTYASSTLGLGDCDD